MNHKHRLIPHILLTLCALTIAQIAYSAEKKPENPQPARAVAEAIPDSARFDLQGISDDRHVLVGRLSLRRQFLGRNATPPYQDFAKFNCFKGSVLNFSTFAPELEERFLKRLADGHSLPVVVTVRFERIRVGHDGINMSERRVARIDECMVVSAESICAAAEVAGYDPVASEQFRAKLNPDLVKGGVAVSLLKASLHTNTPSLDSIIGIEGIRVFNTTSKIATIEIIGLTIEQEGVSQQCLKSKRSRAPHTWQVEASSWSDGNYEKGKTPQTLWMFNPSKPIKPKKEVKLHLELKLNGSEPFVLTRTVKPS